MTAGGTSGSRGRVGIITFPGTLDDVDAVDEALPDIDDVATSKPKEDADKDEE